ncbi:MAG: C40 family peptidase [Bacteroidota bacterium]|nr:C40 family peptidase [Bacteroidota bacterium]
MPSFGICHLSLIPVRKTASERSEMTTQLLFGETFEILDIDGSWSLIRSSFDGYEGWVTSAMITPLSEAEFENYPKIYGSVVKSPVCEVIPEEAGFPATFLAGGSNLPDRLRNIVRDKQVSVYQPGMPYDLITTAKQYLNAPYLWGGRTIFGIDCSGFTQLVYKSNGIAIPRDAYQQAELGVTVELAGVRPGDLAFFENQEGRITHTGIVLENSEIIHASGWVHIDRLDVSGIYNYEIKKYTHKLRIIKRIV